MTHFADRLAERIRATGSIACLGLDPRKDWIPDEFHEATDPGVAFSEELIRLAKGRVTSIKPQLAFFDDEPAGPTQLASVAAPELLSVADAKRGDIGSTAEAYAERWLGAASPFDALTVNPYLGRDSLEPLVTMAAKHGRGLFVLVKTSNKGSADFQDLVLESGERVYERVARLVHELGVNHRGSCGYSLVGAVVGATAPPDLVARLRELMPHAIFLMPGWGAQGGSAASIAKALDQARLGVLVPSSRSLNFPWRTKDPKAKAPADWRELVVRELDATNRQLPGAPV